MVTCPADWNPFPPRDNFLEITQIERESKENVCRNKKTNSKNLQNNVFATTILNKIKNEGICDSFVKKKLNKISKCNKKK